MKRKHDDWALFGGDKAFDSVRTTMNLFPPDEELFFRHVRESFRQTRLSNNGPCLLELEKRLARLHEVKHCIAFSSGFTAMYIAIRNLGGTGKTEVVIPSLTYRKMADIIEWSGFVPRFCDVDERTLGVSRATVEPCVNEHTALVLAPHPRTRLCDIEGLEALCGERGVPLIFDSVEACGAAHNGKMLGGFGACEAFSMHADKIINGAEGGYITTNNSELAEKLSSARAFGFCGLDRITCLGTNAKLNELHAAVALSSLAHHEEQIERNRELHLAYQESLADIPGFNVVDYDRHERRNWRSLLVRLDSRWPLTRDQTLDLLNAENAYARPYYSPPQHVAWRRRHPSEEVRLPVTENAATCHLILPFGSTVSKGDTRIIGRLIRRMSEQGHALRQRIENHENRN